jgi:APA family basic amino acid/polyamine antiporter
VLGVSGVVLVYVLANLAYVRQLGVAGLAASQAPAADVMRQVLGPAGASFISAGIVASTFGFLIRYWDQLVPVSFRRASLRQRSGF